MSIFQTDKAKQEAVAMDKDINRLAENVTNLHALFKQMNEIVSAWRKLLVGWMDR